MKNIIIIIILVVLFSSEVLIFKKKIEKLVEKQENNMKNYGKVLKALFLLIFPIYAYSIN